MDCSFEGIIHRLYVFMNTYFRHIILIFLLVPFIGEAQHPISDALSHVFETADFDEAEQILSNYKMEEIAALPDSVLFDYYYLKAAIKGNKGDEKGKRSYLIAAKELCEKTQGIHSPVYLEICWALGNSFADFGDHLSAFEIFIPTIIQSIGLYSLNDKDVKWQYEDIEQKVIEYYKDDALRAAMVRHRENLPRRDVSKDAVQNDMDFYVRLYKDEIAKEKVLLADSLMSNNSYREAALIYLDIANKIQDNSVAKSTLQELAAMNYINLEEFQPAEKLLLDNLQLLDNYKNSKVYRRTLSQLSNLYNAIHNYSKAKDFAGEAKFWYEENLDFSRGYILCLHRCATLERGNENYFLALLLEDTALQEIYRNPVLGIISGSPISRESFLSNCLSSGALHYNQFGFINEAFYNLEKAIEIAECNNLDASTYYGNMADLCISAKDFNKAVYVLQHAYEISDSNNNRIQIGTTLGLSQFLAKQPISKDIVKESSNCLQDLVNKTFAFTSSEERRNFWSYFEYYFPLLNFLAFQTDDPELNGQIYNNILMEKGLLLRTTNNLRDQIIKSGNNEDILLYDHLLQMRMGLPYLGQLEAKSIKLEVERIDKYLTTKYSSYADYVYSNEVNWMDIRNQLNNEDIAIEFYNIPETNWHEDGSDLDGTPRYCAVVLKKEYEYPKIIPLCHEPQIMNLNVDDIYNTDILYNLIWSPLSEELNGIKNIYFSADKTLHKIGLEYLPTTSGDIMNENYNIYRLSSTRILAENHKNKSPKKDRAVLFGGLIYDMEKDDLIAESRSRNYTASSNTYRSFEDEKYRYGVNYLPATLHEVEQISQNFPEIPLLLTGYSGTEESFRSLSGAPIDIIHLATHGFFWSKEDIDKKKEVNFLKITGQQPEEDFALLRSGLFFSGANLGLKGENLPDDVEDGVLTALELSNMNLGNIDMVVMSACESGLGETSGEGVFGLQRGFKLAGANTLMMSLWKVDDEATQYLMTEFYKNYIGGKTKREALKLAQDSLRKDPVFSDPEYWASFILLDALN